MASGKFGFHDTQSEVRAAIRAAVELVEWRTRVVKSAANFVTAMEAQNRYGIPSAQKHITAAVQAAEDGARKRQRSNWHGPRRPGARRRSSVPPARTGQGQRQASTHGGRREAKATPSSHRHSRRKRLASPAYLPRAVRPISVVPVNCLFPGRCARPLETGAARIMHIGGLSPTVLTNNINGGNSSSRRDSREVARGDHGRRFAARALPTTTSNRSANGARTCNVAASCTQQV